MTDIKDDVFFPHVKLYGTNIPTQWLVHIVAIPISLAENPTRGVQGSD